MNFVNNKFVFDWGGGILPTPAPKPSAKVGQKIHWEIQRYFLGRGESKPPPQKNEFLIRRIWFQSKVN